MRRHSTVRLPLAVVSIVGSAILAVMLGRPEAALFSAPWAALLLLGLTATGDHRLRALVELTDDRIMVGDDVELSVTVHPDCSGWVEARLRPETTLWADGVAGVSVAGGGVRPSSVSQAVTAGRPSVFDLSLPSPSWGTHEVGKVELLLHEPYGLFERGGLVTESRRVRVHPSPMDLNRLLTPWLVRRKTGVHPSVAVDRGVEFADIRTFGSGDSLRDINWRASARSDRILVSQRHPERASDVVLLIDSFVESGHDVRSVVGLGVEAAVALAESHLALTDRVGLVELGGVLRWVSPGTGRLQLHRLTDALLGTRLYANATERDLNIVPRRALPPRSFVVALSPLLDARFIEALFTLRGSGHDVAVIECLYEPPDAEQAIDPELAAAAVRMFDAERSVMRDRLAERGVAIGQWQAGEHLDLALAEVVSRRRRSGRSGR